jgi:predicted NUDIX family NTP pyrophosphohydrolase
MPLHSAGILLYRRHGVRREVFLIHPGGPYWARKDFGSWSIPKGLIGPGEEPLAAARREFHEETGFAAEGPAAALGTFRQPSGKQISVWTVKGDADPQRLASNSFTLVWPPRSGQLQRFPEADQGAWFGRNQAMRRITKGQRPVLERFFARPAKRL